MAIDFTKLSGPAVGSSTPVGPTTPDPGSSNLPALPTLASPGDQQQNQAPWDVVGQALFGRGNGSPLGGVPVLGDVVGAAGNAIHGAGTLVAKPFEIGANLLSHVPLGWLPGGADDNFRQIGEWSKTNDPAMYQQWQTVNAAANGDVLGGGNLKADFNMEAADHYDQMTKDGSLGSDPMLSMGRAGVGSLGGGLSHAIQGWLGLFAGNAQGFLGDHGVFDPSGSGGNVGTIQQAIASKQAAGQVSDDAEYAIKQFQSGAFTEQQANDYLQKNVGAGRSRVEEAIARLDRGETVKGGGISEVEQTAAKNVKSGLWTEQHASDYIISHGQSITRNPVGQIVGGALTDPLTYATAGAAAISKLGTVGKAVQEGIGAQTTYERLGSIVADVQKSDLGPIFRGMRGLIDPLGVYTPKSSATRGLIDLRNGVAVKSLQSAAGPQTLSDMRAIGRETGMAAEVDSAAGAFAMDQANLLMAREHVETELKDAGQGEALFRGDAGSPDELIAPMVANATKDVVGRLTDSIAANLHDVAPHEMENLAGRLATTLGTYDKATWLGRVEKMSGDLRSTLHAITYKLTEKDLAGALAKIDKSAYDGKLPLDRLVLLTENNLDNVSAEALLAEQAAIKGSPTAIADATKAWNEAGRRYPAIADIGYAPGGKKQLDQLVAELKYQLKNGQFHQRALPDELGDPALQPIRDVLDRHTVDGEQLWNVGFRPEESVAWGLKRDAATGAVKVGRDPTISHVMDAVPGRSPFSDTVRNVLGQIIGPAKAEIGAKPLDSVETFMRTATDVVSGRRVVNNIERRFTKTMSEAGLPVPIVRDIFAKARDVAGLDHTTVRGIQPGNLWSAINDSIPRDLVLKDGTHLNVHVVMDHILNAAEGDLRIMGLSSVMTQRMRNIARHAGIDSTNWMGQWTVTMYNKLRYSQPTFLIQRITDAPYFGAMRGMMPMGKGPLKDEALIAMRKIEDNLRRTQTARDFAWTDPEYATRANFTAGIRSKFEQAGLDASKMERIANTPDAIIRNNMTKQMYARMGQIVREVLDHDLPAAIKNAPPEQQAEMMAEAKTLGGTFSDMRGVYSLAAGRNLTDEEVGLKYVQEQIASARRVTVEENGISTAGLIHEGEWSKPSSIGEIVSIRPDALAQELGYADAVSLRKDIHGTYDRATDTIKPGSIDLPAFEEKLREGLNAHPDYVKRASAYFGSTWKDYWDRLALPVEKGGLDISQHYAKEAQDLVAQWAKTRGMDPWEFMSQVLKTNLGSTDLDQHMARLMAFLQAGGKSKPIDELATFFRGNLDVSAQHTFLDQFTAATGTKMPGFGRPPPEGFVTVAPDAFHAAVKAASKVVKSNGRTVGETVTAYSKAEYAKMRTFLSEDGKTGYAIKPDGDLVSVFNVGEKGRIDKIIPDLHLHGATKLDAYDESGRLPDLYAKGGFKETGRDPWNPDYAPKGWKGETPDVVYMQHPSHGADPQGEALDQAFDSMFPQMVVDRIKSGVPHVNPEIEGYYQQFSKWVQEMLPEQIAKSTRHDLRQLVENVPTVHATPFNRTHALVEQLLKDKIRQAQDDVFMLAEMGTRRSVAMRSLNHPLFGVYPASYMWGKVLPQTVKFLAENPYGATYAINNVQRAIALQREYDPEFDHKMSGVDRSSGAFLAGYLTPSLPWEDMQARTSPLVQDIFKSTDISALPGNIWKDELATTSPARWFNLISRAGREGLNLVGGAVHDATMPPPATTLTPGAEQGLTGITQQPAPSGPAGATQTINGPVHATGLAPVLSDQLTQLQDLFK